MFVICLSLTRQQAEDVMGSLLKEYLDVPQKPDEISNTSESGSTSVQQFKNVVAIVDPPRVGLHPVVSYMLDTYSCT